MQDGVAGAKALECLVQTAMAQRELSGISQMLRSIAQSLDAYGCLLWHPSDDSDFEASPPAGSLFVMAHWFDDGNASAFEGIELSSVVGQVAVTGRERNMPGVTDAADISRKLYWWIEERGIRCFCAVPVTFSDGLRGALGVYRKRNQPFTEPEIAVALQLAEALPGLYRAVHDRVSFELVSRIEELTGVPVPSNDTNVRFPLQEICEAIGKTFNAYEASIFLTDSAASPEEFRLQATTWPPETPLSPQRYRLSDEGITPWVLRWAQAIRIFNLGACEPGKPIDDSRYPDLVWRDPLDLVATMMHTRGAKDRDKLQPLSYMISPVMEGTKVLGAIRCCSMLTPPFIFASRDLALLRVAAALVAKFWSTTTEIWRWQKFVHSISKLNQQAEERLARVEPDIAAIEQACDTVEAEFGGRQDSFREVMQQLVRQQRQLYERLGTNMADRISAQSKLEKNLKEQHQTYEDLFHQIKTPINSAFETIRSTLQGAATREAYRAGLETLRSQMRRSSRITKAVGIFAELAESRSIVAHRAKLQHPGFLRAVTELSEDYERMQERYRELRFVVEPRGFEVLKSHEVWVDEDLLFHALANILDNAGKYSYSSTKVRIFVGLTGTARFHISVANKGLRILAKDHPLLTQRGFRSKEAESATGEGSGIGLWLVEKIMEADNGELLIIPSNQEGETEVKLLLRAQKEPHAVPYARIDH